MINQKGLEAEDVFQSHFQLNFTAANPQKRQVPPEKLNDICNVWMNINDSCQATPILFAHEVAKYWLGVMLISQYMVLCAGL